MTWKRLAWVAAGVCLSAVACGCKDPRVEVTLDSADAGLRDKIGAVQSIQVDIVGVNDVEFRRWQQVSMNEYWEPDNAMRRSAKKVVMTFGEGYPSTQVLQDDNPIWKVWKDERQATRLFILAYMPWIQADQPGDADPRRIILPLKPDCWEGWFGNNEIPVVVGSGGLTPLRQPKPECRR